MGVNVSSVTRKTGGAKHSLAGARACACARGAQGAAGSDSCQFAPKLSSTSPDYINIYIYIYCLFSVVLKGSV